MRNDTDTELEHTLPWRMEDIDFTRVDCQRAAANEDLLLLLCAASFIESGSDLYTSNLSQFFHDDPEVAAWLKRDWEPEELQHGRTLKAYVAWIWPEFNWDRAFGHFLEEYSKTCSYEDFEKTYALEMVARCVVEMGTSSLYRAIHACSDEPVLKEITENIRTDEVRHYKYFLRCFKQYNQTEKNGRFTVFGALMRRLMEIRNEDSEIAMRYVVAERYPEHASDAAYIRERLSRVNALIKRNLSAETCVKMLLRPLDLPVKFQPCVQYPLVKFTQHMFFR